jgi:SAM-dependent methyltransferase
MRAVSIPTLVCPYCGGALAVHAVAEQRGDDIRYGLVRCRCFLFPIVEGVLLLSLAKGYGGAEEALQPHAALQIAAIRFLEQNDLPRLKAWLRRHVPLALQLTEGPLPSYLEYCSELFAQLEPAIAAFLEDQGRYEVVGTPTPRASWLGRLHRRRPKPRGRAHQLQQLREFYPTRFFSPYAQSALLQLGYLPLGGRVLSLCCGHGMFENLLNADGRAGEVFSVDGQFLNLMVTQRFVRPDAQLICHDVQFGLPFRDGGFDAVFSSTCLPEIPAQRGFVHEAIRVTASRGWTWFDCVWNGELGGDRINSSRFYRFAQNFFTTLEDYAALFDECAGPDRRVGLAFPGAAGLYRDSAPVWAASADERAALFASRRELQLSALVTNRTQVRAAPAQPARAWLAPGRLAVSPAFDATAADGAITLRRRAGFERLAPNFAPKAFAGYPESATLNRIAATDAPALLRDFCDGLLAVLPNGFDRQTVPLVAP